MNAVTRYGNKDVYFMSGNIRNLYSTVEELRPAFVCAMFLHMNTWSVEDMKGLIKRLLSHGAVYFVFHGNRCEEAHDIADEISATIIPENKVTYNNVIGTDWFVDLSPDEVIFSAFCASVPSDDYLDRFSSFLVISIGTETENAVIQGLIENVDSTIAMATFRMKNSSSH